MNSGSPPPSLPILNQEPTGRRGSQSLWSHARAGGVGHGVKPLTEWAQDVSVEGSCRSTTEN